MNSPLQTDLYQLTMGAAYWQAGRAGQQSVFHLFFRRLPFEGGYAVAAGLGDALDWLESFRFQAGELDYLAGLRNASGSPLFRDEYLGHLGELRLDLTGDAVPVIE